MPINPNKVEPSPVKGMMRFTYTCMMCGQPCEIDIPKDKAEIWLGPAPPFVQNLFPDMSASEREVLISGSHGKCFDEAFADPDDLEELSLEDRITDEDLDDEMIFGDQTALDEMGYYEDRGETGRIERAEEMEDES